MKRCVRVSVAVELPEKQGLKPFSTVSFFFALLSCSGTSRKTRIETTVNLALRTKVYCVAVELPEKQGLKPTFFIILRPFSFSCSGTSRKTRIETVIFITIPPYDTALQWNFQKNKD